MWRKVFACSMSYSPDFDSDKSSSSSSSCSSSPTSDPSDEVITYNEEAEQKASVGSRGSERNDHQRGGGNAGAKQERPKLIRQDTFTVKEGDEFSRDHSRTRPVTASNVVSGSNGIRNILDGKSGSSKLPDEIRNYLNNHFHMIKEENDNLRQSLLEKSRQLDQLAEDHHKCKYLRSDLDKCEQKLKQATVQLDKEKAKSKMMVRQMKDCEKTETPGDNGVVFFGVAQPPPKGPNDAYSNESDDKKMEKQVQLLKERNESKELQVQHLKQVLRRELGSDEAVESALQSNRTAWEGRDEQIKKLEDTLAATKSLLRDARSASSHRSDAEQDWRFRESQTKCQVAEVERDRLTQYSRILVDRLNKAESRGGKIESILREERRKCARLEHLLEKAHIEIRDSDSGKNSFDSRISVSPAQMLRASEDSQALRNEIEHLNGLLDEVKVQRLQDLDQFQKTSVETRKILAKMSGPQ